MNYLGDRPIFAGVIIIGFFMMTVCLLSGVLLVLSVAGRLLGA